MNLKNLKPFDLSTEEKDLLNLTNSFFKEYKNSVDIFLLSLDDEIESLNKIDTNTKIKFLNTNKIYEFTKNYFFTCDNDIFISLNNDGLKKNKYVTLMFGNTKSKNKCLTLKIDYINKMTFVDFTQNHMFHKTQTHYLTEHVKIRLSKEINAAINTDYFFSKEFIKKMQMIKTFLVENKLQNNSSIFKNSETEEFFDINKLADYIEIFNLKYDTNYQSKGKKNLKNTL